MYACETTWINGDINLYAYLYSQDNKSKYKIASVSYTQKKYDD